jgi:hypothetical protein
VPGRGRDAAVEVFANRRYVQRGRRGSGAISPMNS